MLVPTAKGANVVLYGLFPLNVLFVPLNCSRIVLIPEEGSVTFMLMVKSSPASIGSLDSFTPAKVGGIVSEMNETNDELTVVLSLLFA